MTQLKTITFNDIRAWEPCYDPGKWIKEDWTGTALDILKMDHVPATDRLWAVLREDCIDARTLRLFAVWCAREALKLVKDPDPRSVAACYVAERFANGQATGYELAAARAAACAAARAADDAACAAARAASDAAARAAAYAAAYAASDAAARAAQITHLITLLSV